jgi:hypothetical protein
MVRSGCHHAPAAAVRTPDSLTRQVASLEPAAFTGTRPTWTDLAVASMSKCAAPAKLARCPPRQETVAARAVVAVTRREPGAQAPVRAFTARGALFASRSWWRRLKG